MSYSKEEILSHIQSTIEALFEVAISEITPQAHLYDDLDIDSIDAVELIIELKNITGKKISQEVFTQVRTVEDVVVAVHNVLQTH